jgi:hypothetical protein
VTACLRLGLQHLTVSSLLTVTTVTRGPSHPAWLCLQVMMGDDTWMQLAQHAFAEAYPYPSFNVHDLHTVDDGVWEVRLHRQCYGHIEQGTLVCSNPQRIGVFIQTKQPPLSPLHMFHTLGSMAGARLQLAQGIWLHMTTAFDRWINRPLAVLRVAMRT